MSLNWLSVSVLSLTSLGSISGVLFLMRFLSSFCYPSTTLGTDQDFYLFGQIAISSLLTLLFFFYRPLNHGTTQSAFINSPSTTVLISISIVYCLLNYLHVTGLVCKPFSLFPSRLTVKQTRTELNNLLTSDQPVTLHHGEH